MDALSLLRLQQLFDSQVPIGGFAHSGGIETYAQLGMDVAELPILLRACIAHGWGRLDLGAAALAHDQAWDERALDDLGRVVDAAKVVEGPRNASLQLGRRMTVLMERVYPNSTVRVDPPHHAVVAGASGARLDIPRRELLLAFASSVVAGSLAAATRCMRLSPARAQEQLASLHDDITVAVDRALADPEDALFTSTPALDIRAHQQASLYSRLFQS
jgi:urease accessory protein